MFGLRFAAVVSRIDAGLMPTAMLLVSRLLDAFGKPVQAFRDKIKP